MSVAAPPIKSYITVLSRAKITNDVAPCSKDIRKKDNEEAKNNYRNHTVTN